MVVEVEEAVLVLGELGPGGDVVQKALQPRDCAVSVGQQASDVRGPQAQLLHVRVARGALTRRPREKG